MIKCTHVNPHLPTFNLSKVDKYITKYYNKRNKQGVLVTLFYQFCIRGSIERVDPNPIVPWDMIIIRQSGVNRRTRVWI